MMIITGTVTARVAIVKSRANAASLRPRLAYSKAGSASCFRPRSSASWLGFSSAIGFSTTCLEDRFTPLGSGSK